MELISVKKDLEDNRFLAERLLRCFIKERVLREIKPIFMLKRIKHIKSTVIEYFKYLTNDN
jgi:hypothetical protein